MTGHYTRSLRANTLIVDSWCADGCGESDLPERRPWFIVETFNSTTSVGIEIMLTTGTRIWYRVDGLSVQL